LVPETVTLSNGVPADPVPEVAAETFVPVASPVAKELRIVGTLGHLQTRGDYRGCVTYDDCLYCSTCGWHHEDCWCRGGVLRDEDEQVCHRPNPDEGSIGYGRAEVPCTQAVEALSPS